MVSRFQFARPAVVLSFLLQMIFTPPVEAESLAISPLVILVSSSARKDSASACFDCENAFLASFAIRSCFTGLFLGDPSGTVFSAKDLGLGNRVFWGEYSSFQSLTTSCCQKPSILGRCGVDGIRGNCFLGDCNRLGCKVGLPGGVTNRASLENFLGLFSEGELDWMLTATKENGVDDLLAQSKWIINVRRHQIGVGCCLRCFGMFRRSSLAAPLRSD